MRSRPRGGGTGRRSGKTTVFSHCIFCHAALGANESIEEFPIGRRLAFDATRGRLWAICRQCERWNLSPIEERWEAIESCERLFRDTKTRVSTDQIGLCKMREGLELVRIGQPLRPEMAAWRYGDQFGKRRRRYYARAAALGVVATGVVVGGLAVGVSAGTFINLPQWARDIYRRHHVATRVSDEDGRRLCITTHQLQSLSVVRDGGSGCAIEFRYLPEQRLAKLPSRLTTALISPRVSLNMWYDKLKGTLITLRGSEALVALSAFLPYVNKSGGSSAHILDAVDIAADAGHPSQLLSRIATQRLWGPSGNSGSLSAVAPEVRLALEMSLHESDERAAMEGELGALEDRWRDAEEIAAISDNMFLPPGITNAIQRMRGD